MAVVTITASAVQPTGTTERGFGYAGESLLAGDMLRKDPADAASLKKAAYTSASLSGVVGMALCNAADGQPVVYATGGEVTVGSVLTPGESYVISGTAGKMMPTSDIDGVTPDQFITRVGTATDASTIKLDLFAGGTEKATA